MKYSVEFEMIKKMLENALTDPELYRRVCGVDGKTALSEINRFSELKDRAALGDMDARNSIISYFALVIKKQTGNNCEKIISGLVDFENPENNSEDIIFEMVIENNSFGKILEKHNVYDVFDSGMLAAELQEEIKAGRLKEKYNDTDKKIHFVASGMYAMIYGQDCIDSLQHQDVNEIGMLGKDYVYVTFRGRKIRLPFLSSADNGVVINIQKKTTQNSAMNFDRQNPILITSKNNSSRITVAGFDVTPFDKDIYYNERIFNLNMITLEEMRDRYHTIDEKIFRFLSFNQRGRGSFLVTGSDMGVGKSTFLLAMMEKYPSCWGIGVFDGQNELQVAEKYPAKNVITLVENDKKNLSQCFAYLLKTSRDIVVVGEITQPEEVSEMINAAMRLNAGVCGTMHSISPQEVIPNLRNLMLRTDMYKTKDDAEEDASGALDLIIHLKRVSGGRIVAESISEVVCTGRVSLFETDWMSEETLMAETTENLQKRLLIMENLIAQIKLSGKRYELRTIFSFDKSTGGWKTVNSPSGYYFEKMKRYADEKEAEEIKKMFRCETDCGECEK